LAKILRYFGDKVVDALIFIVVTSALTAVYFSIPTLPLSLVFGVIAIASTIVLIIVILVRSIRNRQLQSSAKETFGSATYVDLVSNLPEFANLLSRAHDEIYLMGVSFESINQRVNILKERLKNGVNVRFLALDPDSKHVKDMEETQAVGQLRSRIVSTLAIMHEIKKQYPDNLEIRTYDCPPFHSMIIIDPRESLEGFIQVGFYLYEVDGHSLPTLVVPRMGQLHENEIFAKLLHSYNWIWKRSRAYEQKELLEKRETNDENK